MHFLILDDDINALHMLSNQIEDLDIASDIRSFSCPLDALEWAKINAIDVCVVDYLMPKMDGVTWINHVKKLLPSAAFIMASQVTDRQMISEAYEKGALFFISKPINAIEVKNVVTLVSEKMNMEKALSNIKDLLGAGKQSEPQPLNYRGKLEQIFSCLGMMGEKGTYDLIKICEALCNQPHTEAKAIEHWLENCGERSQTVAQRMRRAMSRGLHHLALIGSEDYTHELFERFAYRLFDPESMAAEMSLIKGKNTKGGRPNLEHFITGIVIEVKHTPY